MSHINHYDQNSKYSPLAQKLVEIASISGRKVVLRNNGQESSPCPTEMIHDIGTTDVAPGDVTAEIMITTIGKIPNEMYDLEDTSISSRLITHKMQTTSAIQKAVAATTQVYESDKESSSGHSSILIALLTALLIILFLCCITACFVARSKRKNSVFGNGNGECEPGCAGMNQPLLDKISSSTEKTSISSLRN